MNYRYVAFGFLLLITTVAEAQVSSHVPTALSKAPTQGSAVPSAQTQDKPVARVNNTILTNSDLVREEYTIFPFARQHNGIPREFEKQIRDGALQMIIFEELVYQEAVREHLAVPAAKMQRAQADFRKQFATPEQYNALLQTEFGGSQQLVAEKIRRSLLIEAFLKTNVESKCVITPVEVKAYYDKNPARFQHPETYTFQTISIIPPANATAAQLKEARARAESALHQAKATKTAEEFGLLAEKVSDDDYRVMMGQHKPVPTEELAPQVVNALKAMHPNDMSGMIQVGQIYTIVRLQAHTPPGKTKFEEEKPKLVKELQESRRNQLRASLDRKLRQNAKIEEM